jgi:predicted GNAT family N-acyltransferase
MRVDYGTELYKSTLELRERILRAPLGLSLWHENLTVERDQEHFAVIDCTGLVLACLIVVPISSIKVKLRQMAVTECMQGHGLGSSLMRYVEAQLQARGVRRIELHARHTALGFYQRLGYIAEGEAFDEVTLPHRKMVRNLS